MKRMIRPLALLLALLASLSLVACSASGKARPTKTANRVVATAGDTEICYDELYYLAENYKRDRKAAAGEDVFADPAEREALDAFVRANLLTRFHALIAVGKDYGIDVEKGEIAGSVQADIDEMIETEFAGDRNAYLESLDADFLTERYLRTYLATENYLTTAIVKEMLERGEVNTDDAALREMLADGRIVRTVHVFLKRGNLYSEEENLAHAAEIRAEVAAGATEEARYARMRNAIGGKYNNDYTDMLGNGFYFARGEMDEAYEAAAFALVPYEVSEVIATEEGYYVLMRLPAEEAYVEEHLRELKESSYFITLNTKVEEKSAAMVLEMTDFGNSLDLLALPEIKANGGATAFTVTWILIAVACVAALFGAGFAVARYRKRKHPAGKK